MNYENQLLLIEQYLDKADRLINQLFPEINVKRKFKRSLVDGLVDTINFITENLNAVDGKRCDELINKLKTSSNTQKLISLEQTQILNNTINTFTSDINNLVKNQYLLNENLNKIILNLQLKMKNIEEHFQLIKFINALTEPPIKFITNRQQRLNSSITRYFTEFTETTNDY
ncbi:hypothetical protein FQA39_LY01950 [Lamprigera yunnana]|nr:hypothetical protein FQA39_LY01950 [Lamprigera yunnana]